MLQPLVMGRAVSIHPLAVVLAIAGGAVLAGIVGALLAVPTMAFVNSAVRVLMRRARRRERGAGGRGRSRIDAEPDDVEAPRARTWPRSAFRCANIRSARRSRSRSIADS